MSSSNHLCTAALEAVRHVMAGLLRRPLGKADNKISLAP